MKNIKLKKRVIEISYKKGLSHISSCLTAIDIIDHIYRQSSDTFILSSGHAALALYVVLEDRYDLDAEKLFDKHGVHPNRDIKNHIVASTGSLGHGVGIAVGHALADRSKEVHVLLSDGECSEGSVWESLRVAWEQSLTNLYVYVNINGWGAYKRIDSDRLIKQLELLDLPHLEINTTTMEDFPIEGLQHQSGHYHVLNSDEYETLKGL